MTELTPRFENDLPLMAGWVALDGIGSEVCHLTKETDGWTICGAVAAQRVGGAYGIFYDLHLSADYSVTRLDIRSAAGEMLTLRHGGDDWVDDSGSALSQLQGCRWVDLRATPLTNVLPIRSHDWSAHPILEDDFVYIDFPSLSVSRVRQRYEYLRPNCLLYRQGDFVAEVTVDAAGLPMDYPGLFRRFL